MSRFYRLLGVSRFADRSEIRQAYWSLTRRFRRENRRVGEDDQRLSEARRAFEVLSDPRSRQGYDGHFGVIRAVGTSRHLSRDTRPDMETSLAADEISTGFPSMTRLVPRVLTDFLGSANQPTHQTRVALTAHQAFHGVRVPLDLPVRPTCPICGGRGETWATSCGVCDGTGSGSFSHHVQFPIPAGVHDGARLTFTVSPPFAADARVELRIAIQ